MLTRQIKITNDISVGGSSPLLIIAGPCVIENEEHTLMVAERLKGISSRLNFPLVFKSSFDKANRTSVESYRGPGLEKGLKILDKVRQQCGLPILSDIHEPSQANQAADILDIIQIPAFLCRQTDMIIAAAKTGKVLNVKKGQFLSPWDVKHILDKITASGSQKAMITERGTAFGYHNLVVDMKSLGIMRDFGYPVIFDATHSTQLPGGAGDKSGGQADQAPALARAAVAAGVDGVFFEVHDRPAQAMSDAATVADLKTFEETVSILLEIDHLLKEKKVERDHV
jgi:2-dehydro-3-deoxyphosphooctonate aldolase (KDO 8-P synthase)